MVLKFIFFLIASSTSLTLIWVREGSNFTPPCWFFLNNSETVQGVTLANAAFSNILLETFMPNLVFLICPSVQILGKTQTGVFPIFEFQNCHNTRTSDDSDMKLGPVTKLGKRTKQRQKNLTMTSCRKNMTSLPFFQFMTNLEHSGSRFLDS